MGKIVGVEMISINKITTDSVEKDFSFLWEFHSGGEATKTTKVRYQSQTITSLPLNIIQTMCVLGNILKYVFVLKLPKINNSFI
jgi:hypothetical protein